MPELTFEVCVDSIDGVVAARAGGAQRVELCAGLVEGGTTPSGGALRAACELGGIEVVALVRPRAGDFVYSERELDVLARDVELARDSGAEAVALGVLTSSGDVDVAATGRLVERARPLAVTFHRAFDLVRDPFQSLRRLVELGIDRVLTSGGAATGLEGVDRIASLVHAASDSLIVVGAGGVRAHNAVELVERTGVRELHFSARAAGVSPMSHRVDLRLGASTVPGEYERRETSEELVRAVVDACRDAG